MLTLEQVKDMRSRSYFEEKIRITANWEKNKEEIKNQFEKYIDDKILKSMVSSMSSYMILTSYDLQKLYSYITFEFYMVDSVVKDIIQFFYNYTEVGYSITFYYSIMEGEKSYNLDDYEVGTGNFDKLFKIIFTENEG